ncbi:MAG: hypothetical protein ABJF11_19090 [Reichenbachiella sp.]|uniref:hypothetical protein n=1 Tax=Reichenbachiella sp. TaxID=2184521 RepID=UPI00326321CF
MAATLAHIVFFLILTLLTQIGGLVYVVSLVIVKRVNFKNQYLKFGVFPALYLISCFLIVPLLAVLLGRERVINTKHINPANYMTVLLNRNYVIPELNQVLVQAEQSLAGTGIEIHYLDASFPFIDGYPLLPHLSHRDGKKLDISLMYTDNEGELTNEKPSMSGYGVFEEPKSDEINQTRDCKARGHLQYDFPKYLTLGHIHPELQYSNYHTRLLIQALLKKQTVSKIFIEPHLKNRLKIKDARIAFHGCGAVRHDDHIHIQVR